MSGATTLYDQAVEVSEEYLGPAGERFIRRQITTHLGIQPETLQKNQLPQLVKWVGLAFAMLTNDSSEIQSLSQSLLSLSSKER